MLQQTRIATVIPAYQRFVRRFPTLRRLALASEDDVLAAWSGLGYYSRARALHRAAQLIDASGAGEFPADYGEARRLPGVGPYTAAAVLSIAYGQDYAAVDGNVVRVLSRLLCLPRPGSENEPYASLAQRLIDPRHPGDWNEALMELGETICTARAPRCEVCPWHAGCEAYRRNRVHAHPPRKRGPRRERLQVAFEVIRDRDGRYLLERGAFEHLPHLWLPILQKTGTPTAACGSVRHAILHRDFTVQVRCCRVAPAQLERRARRSPKRAERRIFAAGELARIGRSSLLTKALRICCTSRK
jgi:A/G-specific adenine glycosylase